jgi:unsaturated chondroitin disaccharide hydrolase
MTDAFGGVLDLLAEKTAEDERRIGVEFPYVTAPDGSWETLLASLSAGYQGVNWSHGNWFCGFWVGLLTAAYLRTGDDRFLSYARERMTLVAPRADDPNTHDIGFVFYSSAKVLDHVTGESAFREIGLRAADRLRRRLVTTRSGAYLSSWGPLDDPRGRASSAIDTMANIPLLYWAAEAADDGSYRLAGEAHALKTRDAFIRPNDSTFHAVEYDTRTGERLRGYTFQGYSDESDWSRGQAWAIYGYVASAAATGKLDYIKLAERLARYWLNRTGEDLVPFWDFDDPAIPNAPRDSAAAAIVAAALVDLAALHPSEADGAHWRQVAEDILAALCRSYVARDGQHRGLLKHGCYSQPHKIGQDSAVLFGDFYFVEALCSVVMPGRFKPEPARLGGTA